VVVQVGSGFDIDTGAAEAAAEVLAEVLVELAGGTELEARVEIRQLEARVEMRQLEELEVFDSPRLSVVVAAEIAAEIAAVLLVAVRY
jgi:hypothetical protein